jgi:RNA polymerase sigma factor (sigma-70 family)
MSAATAVRPSERSILSRATRARRERAGKLLEANFAYMDSPQFRRRSIEAELFAGDAMPELPPTAWYQPTADELDHQAVGAVKLMKADEERLMFLRFNYAKRKLGELQKMAQREGLSAEMADEAIEWHRRYEYYREYLVRTNLALVLAMAKRTRLGQTDFAEIVSEGNMALLRAVDKFNVERGFKFSTYACRAILKAFSRTATKASKRRSRFPVEFEPDLERSDWSDRRRDMVQEECIEELKHIVERNLADLTSVEQTVIRQRFNWQEKSDSELTLEEVGKIIGLTKERVRQIQNKALAKIKLAMEEGLMRPAVAADEGHGVGGLLA